MQYLSHLQEGDSEVEAEVAPDARLQVQLGEPHKLVDAEKLVRKVNLEPALFLAKSQVYLVVVWLFNICRGPNIISDILHGFFTPIGAFSRTPSNT